MKVTEPFRDENDIKRMWSYLVARCMRDAIMFLCGIYLGIRISDILKLCAGDVAGTHLRLKETKTRKTRAILIAPPLRQALAEYCKDLHADDLLFPSRQGYRRPIGRARAYEILRQAARACGLEHIGTHSLRKTFGRAVYQQTHSLTQLREIFGHRDESDTARYIGLQQDDFDAAIGKLRFIK